MAGHTYGFFSLARDLAGNVETLKTQAEATTQVVASDTTPPTTTAAPSPSPNANGWNNSTVTITLTAVDDAGGSGVKQLQFALAGASSGTQTVPGSSAVVAITNEGVTTLTYFATDNSGNQEAPKTLTVQIDKTPPTLTCSASPAANANGWNNTNVTVSFTASDSLSGMATTPSPVPVTSEGANQPVTGTATDKAGNSSSATCQVSIDKTKPVITGSRSPAPNAAGWNNTNVTVSLSCAEVGSVQSGIATNTVADQTLSTEGAGQAVTSTGSCLDKAGNAADPVTLSGINIDKTPPSVSCGSADGLWHASDVSIACTASDGGSGLANAADANFTLSTTVPTGTETATAATGSRSVTDQAGNATTAGPLSGNKVDKKAPSISIVAPTNTSYLLGQSVAANYSCSDGGSGVASCIGPVTNGANINTASVGAKTFTVNATDTVGNASSASVNYSVNYNFSGFFTPVSNPPTVNSLKAGGDITIKFSLGGNQGLTIFAANSPASQPINCTSKSPIGSATPTNPLGSSGLTYTPGPNQYNYTWLTDKAWAGTCRQLLVTLNDGTQHLAYFQFTQ